MVQKEERLRNKHVPIRSCVICNSKSSKRYLSRLVRTEDDQVVFDESGKMNGRGAYLCDDKKCWEKAILTDRLSKALKTSIAPSNAAALFSSIGSSVVLQKQASESSWRT